MKKYKILLSVTISIILVIVWIVNTYNNLIQLNEQVKTQWNQVENVYQRKSDLIPNLVNIVKSSASFENKTLLQIVEERSRNYNHNTKFYNNKLDQNQINEFQKSQEELDNSVTNLLVTVENYPDIKSTKSFYELQNQLEGTENRINVERKKFNEEVNKFNTYRNKFPRFIIADFFEKFKEKGYFDYREKMFSSGSEGINFSQN